MKQIRGKGSACHEFGEHSFVVAVSLEEINNGDYDRDTIRPNGNLHQQHDPDVAFERPRSSVRSEEEHWDDDRHDDGVDSGRGDELFWKRFVEPLIALRHYTSCEQQRIEKSIASSWSHRHLSKAQCRTSKKAHNRGNELG